MAGRGHGIAVAGPRDHAVGQVARIDLGKQRLEAAAGTIDQSDFDHGAQVEVQRAQEAAEAPGVA